VEAYYCCRYFKECVEFCKIRKGSDDKLWWITVCDSNEVIIDYCPFCGTNIGNHYEMDYDQ